MEDGRNDDTVPEKTVATPQTPSMPLSVLPLGLRWRPRSEITFFSYSRLFKRQVHDLVRNTMRAVIAVHVEEWGAYID
jgi:hypothetical protein